MWKSSFSFNMDIYNPLSELLRQLRLYFLLHVQSGAHSDTSYQGHVFLFKWAE